MFHACIYYVVYRSILNNVVSIAGDNLKDSIKYLGKGLLKEKAFNRHTPDKNALEKAN